MEFHRAAINMTGRYLRGEARYSIKRRIPFEYKNISVVIVSLLYIRVHRKEVSSVQVLLHRWRQRQILHVFTYCFHFFALVLIHLVSLARFVAQISTSLSILVTRMCVLHHYFYCIFSDYLPPN
jgi:hypothetical protein